MPTAMRQPGRARRNLLGRQRALSAELIKELKSSVLLISTFPLSSQQCHWTNGSGKASPQRGSCGAAFLVLTGFWWDLKGQKAPFL